LHLTTIVIENTALNSFSVNSSFMSYSHHRIPLLNPGPVVTWAPSRNKVFFCAHTPLPSHADSTISLHPNCHNVTIHKRVQNQGAFLWDKFARHECNQGYHFMKCGEHLQDIFWGCNFNKILGLLHPLLLYTLEELYITIGVMSAYKGLVHTEFNLSWVQIILFLLKEKLFFFDMIKGLAKFYAIYALQSSNCLNILYDQY
jgi:hypothetical protein